jgi:hypothetical protein
MHYRSGLIKRIIQGKPGYYFLVIFVGIFTLFPLSTVIASNDDQFKTYLIKWDALGDSFSISDKGGVRVGNDIYPIRFNALPLSRHTLSQIEDLVNNSLTHLTAETRQMLLDKHIKKAVVECFPDNDGLTCKPLEAGLTDENSVTYKGERESGGFLGTGPGAFYYGFFVLRDNAPWKTAKDCTINFNDCIFVTEENTLFLKNGSKIASSDCWFSIGNYEILGAIEVVQKGIKLLRNTEYRQTGFGGMVSEPQVIEEKTIQETEKVSVPFEEHGKLDCEAFKPVSALLQKYIEEEVNKFVGIVERRSDIIDTENFLYTVIGISEEGDDIEEAVYRSTDKEGEIIAGYSIVTDDFTPDEKMGYYDDKGDFHPSREIVTYRKTIADGSQVIMKDGGVFIFTNKRWNRCIHKTHQ